MARDNAKVRADLTSMEDGIDYAILPELVRVMKKINIFIWCSKHQMLDIMNFFLTIENRPCNFEVLVWAKTNTLPKNNSWLSDMEYCLYFREEGVRLNKGYDLKSKWYMSCTNKVDKGKFNHPAIKPLQFVTQHILHSTQPNDIVLDGFVGSGTTAVSCINEKRKYLCFEIDPYKYKVAVDRTKQIDANGQMSMFAL